MDDVGRHPTFPRTINVHPVMPITQPGARGCSNVLHFCYLQDFARPWSARLCLPTYNVGYT